MPNNFSSKIYELRKRHHMTLEQVANIVGVGKSTVRKWETGMIANVKRDKIALLAKALHTTPAYLMGWEEDKEDAPTEPKLSEGEEMLLKLFRKLPQEAQDSYIERLEEALKTLGLI
jgi:transcriptional regulator with XRE-family HTH domain